MFHGELTIERKIPPEAFDFYFELGPGRSYQAVADHFSVTKQAVTKKAVMSMPVRKRVILTV